MCIIHDQKFACGCWRRTDAEVTHCMIALRNANPITHDPTPCPRHMCKPAIRPSVWYCLEHARCKKFAGNYEDLKVNLSSEAVDHVLRIGDYNFELKPPSQSNATPAQGQGSPRITSDRPASMDTTRPSSEGMQVHAPYTHRASMPPAPTERFYAKTGGYIAFTPPTPVTPR